MTSTNDQISLEDLCTLHELQKRVCDLATIKCAGHLRVHIQCQQGEYRNALVIGNKDNGRTLYLYLTAQGWLFVAQQASGRAWELPLIGPINKAIHIIQDRIEAFLLPQPSHQKAASKARPCLEPVDADQRLAIV